MSGQQISTGRTLAAAAVVLAAYGTVTLLVLGRADHFGEGFVMFVMFALGFGLLAWLAIPLQPDNRALWVPAWASFFAGLGAAGWATAVLLAAGSGLDTASATFNSYSPADLPVAAALAFDLVSLGAVAGFFPMLTLWLLLFPDGQFASQRWRRVAVVAIALMTAATVAMVWLGRPQSRLELGASPEDEPGVGTLAGILYVLLVLLAVVCAASLLQRYRKSTAEARQQLQWVGVGTAALFFAMFIIEPGGWQPVAASLGVVVAVASYGVAVTKYRLYGIDVVISRTLVFGTLALFIGGAYVGIVVVLGGLMGATSGDLALSIVATAAVAVAFEPVRRNAQRWANRIVYGRRATPYEVLSDLTRRLAGAEPAEGVLVRMAQLMAEGTGADQSTVWLADGAGDLIPGAAWPDAPETASAGVPTGATTPVYHDGELVGMLEVVKGRGNPVTPLEQRLLRDLAGSAGLILGNQRLNASLAARAKELQRSRRRLVELQDEERRRLERDLHDGAQQQVVALKLKIGLAEHVAKKQGAPELAVALRELAGEAQLAVDEIRTLAKGIYPPLLESEALPAAIRAHAALSAVPVELRSGTDMTRYSKDVESAVYFAAIEAMGNAVKHGAASRIWVMLRASSDALELEVADDGMGLTPGVESEGLGLTNVRDRVEALDGEMALVPQPGGGAILTVRIPLDMDERPPTVDQLLVSQSG